MTSTSIRTDRGASQTLSGGTRNAGNRAMRAAGRQLLATAGNQVLKVAVDRAVGKVDQVADRLDTVAAGGGRSPRSAPTRQPPERPTGSGGQRPEHPMRVKMGAAFSFVVQQAVHLLQLIQRLAQQLLAALTRLVRRREESAPDTTSDEARGADRPAADSRIGKNGRADEGRDSGEGEGAARPARTSQAPRRPRPRSATAEPAGPRRRVAADRPARSGRND
jgi:hypothetical protein